MRGGAGSGRSTRGRYRRRPAAHPRIGGPGWSRLTSRARRTTGTAVLAARSPDPRSRRRAPMKRRSAIRRPCPGQARRQPMAARALPELVGAAARARTPAGRGRTEAAKCLASGPFVLSVYRSGRYERERLPRHDAVCAHDQSWSRPLPSLTLRSAAAPVRRRPKCRTAATPPAPGSPGCSRDTVRAEARSPARPPRPPSAQPRAGAPCPVQT